jgi:hypothetical protein
MNIKLTKTTAYFLISILSFIVIVLILPDFRDLGDFYNGYWGPAKLLLTHRSPYDIKQLFPEKSSLWMPQFISVGLFLGLLEKEVAGKIWVFLNFISLVYILFSLFDHKPNPIRLGFLLIGLILFPPLSTNFLFGQCSLICITFLLMAVKVDSVYSPLALLIGLGKPQMGILFLIGISLLIWQKGKPFLLNYLTRLVGWMILLISPFYIFYPDWLSGLINNYQGNANWDMPTLLNLLNKHLGTPGVILWAGMVLFGIALTINFWVKFKPQMAAVLTLAMTPIISPYLWSWDFVLLFPLIIHFSINGSKLRSTLMILALSIVNIIFWNMRMSGPVSDFINWPIPIILLGSIGLIQVIDGRKSWAILTALD